MSTEGDSIRSALQTGNERERADAVRAACPCHGSFELLRELQHDLYKAASSDSSSKVRGVAKHVLRDAYVVNHNDERREDRDRRLEAVAQHQQRQRAARNAKALRRSRPSGNR